MELRRLDQKDLIQAFEWRNDPRIYTWCRQPDKISWAEHMRWFDRINQPGSDCRMYALVQCDKLRGVAGLTSIDLINRKAEFSLYVGPEHQHQGLGAAALNLLLDIGFNIYGLNSIWGESFEGNPAMLMFSKLGFKRTGTSREAYFRDGRFIDAHIYSILRSEYVSRNPGRYFHRPEPYDTGDFVSEAGPTLESRISAAKGWQAQGG